jgi:predicted nucleic acid-binding protein
MNGIETGINNMSSKFLIDTDVLIDYLKGRDEAVRFLESQHIPMLVSAITVGELYAGVREGKERFILDDFIEYFRVISLNNALAVKGGLFRRDFQKSHSVGLADAMIAATAESENATLVTLNQKHFPMISDILIPYQKN